MYRKLVKTLKATRMIRMAVTVPVMIFLSVMLMKMFNGNDTVDRVLRIGMLILFAVICGYVCWDYLHCDRDLQKMQQVVGARSDFEMDQVLASCQNFGDCYFISQQFVLNFVMCNAYLKSDIRSIENDEIVHTEENGPDRREYSLEIRFGGKGKDRMLFSSPTERSSARKLLEAEL